ncbi:MAG: TaqI-like C-terminal specificity domain-containing protein, partial [Sedimentisphaerales bacterium]
TYLLFVEKAIRSVKERGLVGMIIPNTWLLNLLSKEIRKHIFNQTQIENIIHYKYPVFHRATVDTEITVFRKIKPSNSHKINITIIEKDNRHDEYFIPQERWQKRNGQPVNLFEREEMFQIATKLEAFPKLDTLSVITQGAKPFQVGKGSPPQTRKIVDEKPFVSEERKNSTFCPLLRGSLMQRYVILWKNDYWISFGDWLAEPRYSAAYDAPAKIIVRQTGDSIVATLDTRQFVVRDNLYTIVPRDTTIDLRFVLGLLDSHFMNWYYQRILNPEQGEALAQVKRGHLAKLPIPSVKIKVPADKAKHDKMVKLVDRMLDLHKKLAKAKVPADKTQIQRQISTTDHQIDNLVYELYNLTHDEIAIIQKTS